MNFIWAVLALPGAIVVGFIGGAALLAWAKIHYEVYRRR